MEINKILPLIKRLKATESDGWDNAKENSCCPGDDWADGYNEAIKDVVELIEVQQS